MNGHGIQIFFILSFLLPTISGCKNIKPANLSSQQSSSKSPYIEPSKSNAKRVLSLAFEFAQGAISSDSVTKEFNELSETQIKQLALKKIGEARFLWLLSKGIISSEIVVMARKFLTTIPKVHIYEQLSAQIDGKTALENLYEKRPIKETLEERHHLMGLFLIAQPELVNQLKDQQKVFNVEEFNALITKIDETKIAGVAEVLDSDNILAWLNWATLDESPQERERRLLSNFRKIYLRAGPYKQFDMRNFLLEKAYADDIALTAQGLPALKLSSLIEELPILGLSESIGADVYQLSKHSQEHGKHKGSFLYVISKRISEDVLRGSGLSWLNLRALSQGIKDILRTNYEDHIKVSLFGNSRETILVSLEKAGLSKQAAKLMLHVSIRPEDVYQELRLISSHPSLAERKVSIELRMLLEDYQSQYGILDDIARIMVPQADNRLGNLLAQDYFIHSFSKLKTDALALETLRYFTQHLSDRATVINQTNARARSALAILTHKNRSNQLVGDEHKACIRHLLSEILRHGDNDALRQGFHDINDASLAILGSFAYEHRTETIRGTTDSIANLSFFEYTQRGAQGKKLARALIEAALKDASLGNTENGVIGLIHQGFLSREALLDRGYNLFDSGRYIGMSNTLLYDVLLMAAAKKLVEAVAQSYPDNQAYAQRWKESYKILNSKIRGRGDYLITAAVGNIWIANAALPALEGALSEAEIRALVQVYKAKLPIAQWVSLARTASNASSQNKMVWELLSFTVAGRAGASEALARTAVLLDY